MSERCRALRVAAWRVDAESGEIQEPAAQGDAQRWLSAPSLREWVRSLSKAWLDQEAPTPRLIGPGCWALPGIETRNRRVTGVIVGVTFEPDAFDGAWFGDVCREAGVDPGMVREGLGCYTGPGPADLPLLTEALGQTQMAHDQTRRDGEAIELFSEQLLETYEQMNLLFRLSRTMNGLDDPYDLIPTCCNQMLPVLPFAWIAVRFWDHRNNLPGLTGRLVIAGELPCAAELFDKAVVTQFAGQKGRDWTRLLNPTSSEAASLVGSEIVVDQITHDDEVVGVLLAGNKSGDSPQISDVASGEMLFLEAASNLIGVFHENIARFTEQRQFFKGTLRALTSSIDAKDPYTRGHSERVAYLGALLTKAIGRDEKTVECVHTAGLVHDVGKIGVPEAVLCKPGELTPEEFDQIKQHPTIGYEILKDIPQMAPMLPGVLSHHERWDGKGYPQGLKGEDIPQLGRILALADTFDAMSSTRSYRPAMPREIVLGEIKNCGGTQFDPELAPLFVKLDFTGYDQMARRHQVPSGFAA